MNRYVPALLALTTLALLHPAAAHAYIGPGVGAGAIAAVVGVLGSILLAIVAVVYYPVKRMMKGRRAAKSSDKPAE
jgi:hypothetical protein